MIVAGDTLPHALRILEKFGRQSANVQGHGKEFDEVHARPKTINRGDTNYSYNAMRIEE